MVLRTWLRLGRHVPLIPDGGQGTLQLAMCSMGVLREQKYCLRTCVVILVLIFLACMVLRMIIVCLAPVIDVLTVVLLSGVRSCRLTILTDCFLVDVVSVVLMYAPITGLQVSRARLLFLRMRWVELTGRGGLLRLILFPLRQCCPGLKKMMGLLEVTVRRTT